MRFTDLISSAGRIAGSVFSIWALCTACATQKWVHTELDQSTEKLRTELQQMTRETESALEKETAKTKSALQTVDGIQGQIAKLQASLENLKISLDTLKKHIDTSFESQQKQMTSAWTNGDQKVRETLLKQHQDSVDSMRKEMERVESARQQANQLARTLQEMVSVYRSITRDMADEYKSLQESIKSTSSNESK